MRIFRFFIALWIVFGVVSASGVAVAANLTRSKPIAEAHADEALVYLIREKRFVGGGRTMFVYADQTFLGALDNDSYTFAYVPPGKHLLWLNWANINTEVNLEAGKTYYFNIWTGFDALDERSGKVFLNGIASYAKADARETAKAEEHIRERYGKAVASAATKPVDATRATSLQRRAAHIASWPKADLAAYPALCVEPFAMVDPKAGKVEQQYLVESAPQRMSALVLEELGSTAFASVRTDGNCGKDAGTVVLRARITQYKPGNDFARFMLAGAGSAQIEMVVDLVSADTGQTLAELTPKGTWAWGGALGVAKSISDLEKNVAYEIAGYLKVARGQSLPD